MPFICCKEEGKRKVSKNFIAVNPQSLPYSGARLTNVHTDRPQIAVGPVIGVVTDTTARILLEASQDVQVTVSAIGNADGIRHIVRQPKKLVAGLPSGIALKKLKPDTRYTVFVNLPTPGLITSSFKTRPQKNVGVGLGDCLETAPLRLSVVSGNTSFRRSRTEKVLKLSDSDDKADSLHFARQQGIHPANREKCQRLGRELWKNLYDKVYNGEIDVLVHLGNIACACGSAIGTGAEQKYSQIEKGLENLLDPFERALSTVSRTGGTTDAYFTACDIFRNMYRTAWNAPYVKHVMANVSNYITMNESEVGSWVYPIEGTDQERFIAACAFEVGSTYQVYNEYVRNLFTDYPAGTLDSAVIPLCTHKTHVLNRDVALMFIDLKACKALRLGSNVEDEVESSGLPHLGVVQWNDILSDLEPHGKLDTVKCLILSSQQRLSDPRSMWYRKKYRAETFHLLRRIFDWRNRLPFGHREVLILSSDSESFPSSGVADILIDTIRYSLPDPRCNRLRELSLTGIGHLNCLVSVPNLRRPQEYEAIHAIKESMSKRAVEVEEMTDMATPNKVEGGIIKSVTDLRNPCNKTDGLSIQKLGMEFLSVQYK